MPYGRDYRSEMMTISVLTVEETPIINMSGPKSNEVRSPHSLLSYIYHLYLTLLKKSITQLFLVLWEDIEVA